jgi:hypothetical protein
MEATWVWRLRLVLVIGVAALTVNASEPCIAKGGITKRACDARRGTTLAANEQVRVYRVGSSRQFTAKGCYYRTRRAFHLGGRTASEPPHEANAFDFVLSGRFVAVDEIECEPVGCSGGIAVTDVKTGRVRRSASVAGGTGGNAQRIVLKRNGSVAWTRPFNGTFEVVRLDGDGEAVVDRGAGVDVQSLALASGTLYWMNAGVPRSATLN